ncbi:hypothetical protein BLOT_009449 [Blomia tropicalis]|nr:hypothetical protein BLOT_009449 [Blomia tropicalis]
MIQEQRIKIFLYYNSSAIPEVIVNFGVSFTILSTHKGKFWIGVNPPPQINDMNNVKVILDKKQVKFYSYLLLPTCATTE